MFMKLRRKPSTGVFRLQGDIMRLRDPLCAVVFILLSIGGATCQRFTACTDEAPTSPSKKLPQLPTQFEAIIDATILQKNYTTERHEWVDYDNNRAASRGTFNGSTSQSFYDFHTYEVFNIRGGNCTASDIRKGFHPLNYTDGPSGAHIGSTQDLLRFGTKYGEKFISDNETVRGIPVTHWQSCLRLEAYNATMYLDYYFTRADYQTAMGRRQQVPVRATLKGSADNVDRRGKIEPGQYHSFDHIYEYTYFRAGPIKDQSVFQTPPGLFCAGRKNTKPRPVLPDQFTYTTEVISPRHKHVSIGKMFFDYKAKFYGRESSSSRFLHSNHSGPGAVRVIHDYNTGLQYVIDLVRENCSMEPIPLDSSDAKHVDEEHLQMRHAFEFHDMDKHNYTYEGQRVIRDVLCDVWLTNHVSPAHRNRTHSGNITVELYFMSQNWTSGSQNNSDHPILMGLWLKWKEGPGRSMHVYDFRSGPPDRKAFEIEDCYDSISAKQPLTFRMPGTYQELVRNRHTYITQAIRTSVAEAARVSPIRINNIYFDQTTQSYIDVWFTILDKPPIKGDVLGVKPQLNLTQAYAYLKKEVKLGLAIGINYPQKPMVITVKRDSLLTDKEVFDPRIPLHPCGYDSGYSDGSMAGLGVAMLILGMILGVVFSLIVWKRVNTDVPYQVQE